MEPLRLLAKMTLLLLWVGCDGANGPSDSEAGRRDESRPTRGLVLGSISSKPAEEIAVFLPLARHLERQLDAKVTVRVARNVREMANLMERGEVDFYIDSPFPTLAVQRLADTRLVLRRWKKGVAQYSSVLFVRSASSIQSLDDLRGKTVAFEERHSSAGYQLPRMMLESCGLELEAEPGEGPRAERLCYVFSEDDVNTVAWVRHGKVDAGATNEAYLQASEPKDLRILATSAPIPRQLVSVRSTLDAKWSKSVTLTLKNLEETEAGRQTLAEFEKTARFDDIPDDVMETVSTMQEYASRTYRLE